MHRRPGVLRLPASSITSTERKHRTKQVAPYLQCFAVVALTCVVDGETGLLRGRRERFAGARYTHCIHRVADGRPQTSWIGPRITDAIGHGREELLDLACEIATPGGYYAL